MDCLLYTKGVEAGQFDGYYVLDIFIKNINALLVPIFWGHFYFGPYIFILPLLVPKPINA